MDMDRRLSGMEQLGAGRSSLLPSGGIVTELIMDHHNYSHWHTLPPSPSPSPSLPLPYIQRMSHCIQEIKMNEDGITHDDVLCTECQRDFWNSVHHQTDNFPQLHDYTLLKPRHYLDRVKRACGQDFFVPPHFINNHNYL